VLTRQSAASAGRWMPEACSADRRAPMSGGAQWLRVVRAARRLTLAVHPAFGARRSAVSAAGHAASGPRNASSRDPARGARRHGTVPHAGLGDRRALRLPLEAGTRTEPAHGSAKPQRDRSGPEIDNPPTTPRRRRRAPGSRPLLFASLRGSLGVRPLRELVRECPTRSGRTLRGRRRLRARLSDEVPCC
jgi:hypothetical protein